MTNIKTLEDEFWLYAGDVYAREGVAPILLDWQERWGANVNTVLMCLWAAKAQRVLDPLDFDMVCEAVSGWHAAAVIPLRRLRQRLKTEWTALAPDVEPARKAILAAELEAERAEQAIMIRVLAPWPERMQAADEDIARQNLMTYLKNADPAAAAVAELLAHMG